MAKKRPEYFTIIEQLEKRLDGASDNLLAEVKSLVADTLDGMEYNPFGRLVQSRANSIALAKLQRGIDSLTREFVVETVGDEKYFDEWLKGKPESPPNTLVGNGTVKIADLAQELADVTGAYDEYMIAENLNTAADWITTAGFEQRRAILTRFRDTIANAEMPRVFEKWLEDECDKPKWLAKTISQGTYMATYQAVQMNVADAIGTEFFMLDGPPLVEDSHELCIEHLGEIHAWDVWVEIGRGYGIDETTLRLWRGGYGCRHTFVAMPREEVPDELIKKEASNGTEAQ